MPTLHLIVGLPAAGKTTLVRQLERERSALRLTTDEWMIPLFGGPEETDAARAARDRVEALLFEVACRALQLGIDVVLDFGCWSRAERERFRAGATRVGANSVLYFLDVPEDVLVTRVEARNASLPPDTYHIDPALVRAWARVHFEPPSAEELRPRDVNGQTLLSCS